MRLLLKWNDWPVLHGAAHSSHAHTHARIWNSGPKHTFCTEALSLWNHKVSNTPLTDVWEVVRRHRKGHHTAQAKTIPVTSTHVNKDLRFPVFLQRCEPPISPWAAHNICCIQLHQTNTGQLKRGHYSSSFLSGYKTDLMRQVSSSRLQTSWAVVTADLVKLENTKCLPSPPLFYISGYYQMLTFKETNKWNRMSGQYGQYPVSQSLLF